MIEIPFLWAELIYTAVWILIRAAVWIKRKHIDWKREAMLLLMYVNLAVIIRFTFFPMARADGFVQPLIFDPDAAFPFRLNLVPFVNMFVYSSKSALLMNHVGNIAMFIPSGIIIPVLYKRLNRFWKVVLTGAGISLVIELLQLPFSARTSDIDDLILNTLGVMTGYGIYALVQGLRSKKNADRKQADI